MDVPSRATKTAIAFSEMANGSASVTRIGVATIAECRWRAFATTKRTMIMVGSLFRLFFDCLIETRLN